MSEWTIFGERLKKQLEECGMTYREFAEKVGLSVPTICRFVNCETVPRATELLKIANVLGVNCNYLLGVIDDPYRDCPHHPKENLPSAEPEIKPISYQDCSNAMLMMWMDNVITNGEYNRIMDKLNAKHMAERKSDE